MGKNNAALLSANDLKDIKNRNKQGEGQKRIAKTYQLSPTTVGFAIRANSVAEFKKMLAERSAKEVAARRTRKAAKKQNDKAQAVAAEKIIASADELTPKQVKAKILALELHNESLEERLQTVMNLLVGDNDGGDNIVSRVYRLEGKKTFVRRFLERF